MIQLCHDLFSKIIYSFLFDSVLTVYKKLIPNLQQRINNIVELISDLRDPSLAQQQVLTQTQQNNSAPHVEAPAQVEQTEPVVPTMSTHQIQMKISQLKFQRLKLKDDFDAIYKECRNVQKDLDLNRLAELRVEIKAKEDEIAQLQAQLNGGNSATAAPVPNPPATPVSNEKSASEPNQQQQTQAENTFDPIAVAHHCLKLAICLLRDPELKVLTPQIRSLCDTLIIPNIGSVHEEIRASAVKALTLVCILKLDFGQKFVPLLLEIIQRDKKDVVVEAFKGMINCMMAFAIGNLVKSNHGDMTNNQSANMSDYEDQSMVAEATGKIISVITSLLDHDDPDIYTIAVEGFCKLYMTGHILSSKLFSKLLIMYYSPLNENDVRLKAILSAFLPQFSFMKNTYQLCVEEAFMPTLKCLINAPADSYLCEIDLIKVMETLFNLTNPKNLIQKKQRTVQNVNNLFKPSRVF